MLQDVSTNLLLQFEDRLENTGMSFHEPMRKHFIEHTKNILATRHRKNIFLALAFIAEVATPTLKCAVDGDKIYVKCSSWRSGERIVLAEKYCRVSYSRFDTVLVVRKNYGRCSLATIKDYWCRFARAFHFWRIKDVYVHKAHCLASGKIFRKGELRALYREPCCLRWYGTLNKNVLLIHNIERDLNFKCLRWWRNPGVWHALTAGK